jgi:hypothetical protein
MNCGSPDIDRDSKTKPRLGEAVRDSPDCRSDPAWGFPDYSEALVRFPRLGAKTRKKTLAES